MINASNEAHMKRISPEYNFINFVADLKRHENSAKVLLQLQYYSEIHVSIVMFNCWSAAVGQGRLSKGELQQLLAVVSVWHQDVFLALKRLQGLMAKSQLSNNLKTQIIQMVESAEQGEYLMLTDLIAKRPSTAKVTLQKMIDACKNIAVYCKLQQVTISNELIDLFYQLVACVFPQVDLRETHQHCFKILKEELMSGVKQGNIFA